MNKIKTFSWKLVPVLGIGAYLDQYVKCQTGIDGWNYTIILPFVRIQFGEIYIATNEYTHKAEQAVMAIRKLAEANPHAPTITEIKAAYEKFMNAVERGDLVAVRKASEELGGCVVRWEVEKC